VKQIEGNPGGVILDYGDLAIDIVTLKPVIANRIAQNNHKTVDVLVLHKDQLLRAYRKVEALPPPPQTAEGSLY
jgi:hypothetical protein